MGEMGKNSNFAQREDEKGRDFWFDNEWMVATWIDFFHIEKCEFLFWKFSFKDFEKMEKNIGEEKGGQFNSEKYNSSFVSAKKREKEPLGSK